MIWAVSQRDLRWWNRIVPAIFLGVALSSRANFVLLLPLVFSAMVRIAGWRPAVKYAAISGTMFLLLTVPFYLYDPQAFSPLYAAGKLGQFEPVLPFAGWGIPVATLIVALILAFLQPASRGPGILLGNCAIVLAFPVLCGIVLFSVMTASPNFRFASYGTFFLFFGVVALWSSLFDDTELEVSGQAPAVNGLAPRDGRVYGKGPMTRDGISI
jgi:hypothetical protein